MLSDRRVAVTGLGIQSPLGNTTADLLESLRTGRSGIRRLAPSLASRLRSPIGAPIDFDGAEYFDAPQLRMMDRFSQIALAAARQAVLDAGIDFAAERRSACGVFVGCGMGGSDTTDQGYQQIYAEKSPRVNPFTVLATMTNAAAAWIAMEYGLRGPNLTFSTACSSSAVALGEAARRISSGDVDIMLAGGTEAPLGFGTLRAWEAMRTLATEDLQDPSASCKPFSRNRTGLVLGEGAAFVVLEEKEHARARGATIHAELTGYGTTCDASHITRPDVGGQADTIQGALRSAKLAPADIGYINAHGTATLQNDGIETEAIKRVFGEGAYRIPISSTKSTHGHLLGAAGALEFVISVLTLTSGFIPPTMHLNDPDPACDLDYVPNAARRVEGVRAVMSNSFAFGGTNAVLIAERADGAEPRDSGFRA
jgi:beta-ketoacyl-acyl-carrier-protein synthase II